MKLTKIQIESLASGLNSENYKLKPKVSKGRNSHISKGRKKDNYRIEIKR